MIEHGICLNQCLLLVFLLINIMLINKKSSKNLILLHKIDFGLLNHHKPSFGLQQN